MSARVSFDHRARAVYVSFQTGHNFQTLDVGELGTMMIDFDRNDRVLGVELLAEPFPADHVALRPLHWIVITRAWDMVAQIWRHNAALSGELTVAYPE